MIDIYIEPKGEVYEKLIDYALQTTDAFIGTSYGVYGGYDYYWCLD